MNLNSLKLVLVSYKFCILLTNRHVVYCIVKMYGLFVCKRSNRFKDIPLVFSIEDLQMDVF